MPSMTLFGRKWLAGSDDMVFPSIIELFIRVLWLSVIGTAAWRYYWSSYSCDSGGDFIRVYLLGKLSLLALVSFLLVLIINRSAKGSIIDLHPRRHVPILLSFKILLIIPEVAWNMMGTVWAYTDVLNCNETDEYTSTAIDVVVGVDWVLLALALFTLFMVIDPMGSMKENERNEEALYHRKVTQIWVRRFRWFFCWIIRDKHSHEAFSQVAGLMSWMFRGTDLVPTDVIAGLILLRVKQKRESREQRRIELMAEQRKKYSPEVKELFSGAPSWMSLEKAEHYMRLCLSIYSCHMVLFLHCFTGTFKILANSTCCSCIRSKPTLVRGDNCCLCSLAGVKTISRLTDKEILFASFKNHIFEVPFMIVVDEKYKCIVVVVRGSLSLRDIFTDLSAQPETIEAEGLPPESQAHKGMLLCAMNLKKTLEENNLLEKAFSRYPNYGLVVTGHSLGAGTATLLAIFLRPKYPDIKVYGFATPGGLLSKEAAEYTEDFIMTVAVGDDWTIKLSIEAVEELRTQLFQVLSLCRLPKYRVLLNGFGYSLLGIPSRDLETTWRVLPTRNSRHNTALIPPSNDVLSRKYSKTKLFTAGRILHIVEKRKTKDKKSEDEETFEMKWLKFDELTEVRIMPRMLLDHFPNNVLKTISTVLEEQRTEIVDLSDVTII